MTVNTADPRVDLRSGRQVHCGPLVRAARKMLHGRLSLLKTGSLRLRDPWGEMSFGPDSNRAQLVVVHDGAFFLRAVASGSLGIAESYLDGQWDTEDLVAVFQLFLREDAVFRALDSKTGLLKRTSERFIHRLFRRNTKDGSRQNIASHYDLSNELFALFLDETMSYSSAIFTHDAMTLAEASRAKLDIVARKLRLNPSDHLLEIGTGWGGLAIHVASTFGCRVTTTTISAEQHAWATQEVHKAGLADRIDVRLEDYRDVKGQFSKIVSIEMLEAVGAEYYGTFFAKCSELLSDDGLMLVQTITIDDRFYEEARRDVDFIKRYIFPGCCIPSNAVITNVVSEETDFRLVDLEDIGPDYAETLLRWRSRFNEKIEEVSALGFDQRFVRLWNYYLAYCEAGFIERRLSDLQCLWAKPDNRVESLRRQTMRRAE